MPLLETNGKLLSEKRVNKLKQAIIAHFIGALKKRETKRKFLSGIIFAFMRET
jgi:hypothetical protein